jgi:hypothetical protein
MERYNMSCLILQNYFFIKLSAICFGMHSNSFLPKLTVILIIASLTLFIYDFIFLDQLLLVVLQLFLSQLQSLLINISSLFPLSLPFD